MADLGGRLRGVDLPLRSPRLRLRLPRASDARGLARAGNDRRVARGTHIPHPFTVAKAAGLIARTRRRARAGEGLALLIEEVATGEPLGLVGLSVNPTDPAAVLFYWISPRAWGRGLASEAVLGALELAFGPLHLHRVGAYVLAFNHRSERLLHRAGFRLEGRAREVRRDGGRWQDELAFGLLAEEHRKVQRRREGERSPKTRARRPKNQRAPFGARKGKARVG